MYKLAKKLYVNGNYGIQKILQKENWIYKIRDGKNMKIN